MKIVHLFLSESDEFDHLAVENCINCEICEIGETVNLRLSSSAFASNARCQLNVRR